MAVSSIKDFWIHPNALTITLNYFGDPQLIQTSMLAGAVIMAYRKDVISYDAAHNFREWKLQAFPTQLNDTCTYYVHAELSRGGDTAMIIYSPVKRDIEGRTLLRVEKDENGRDVEVWDDTISTESYFIYLGTISASVDNDGATVERAWTDGFYTGTLDTDQQRMEEASGEWKTMFNYNDVIGQIEPQKPFSKIKVMGEAIFQSIAQFVNGLVIGKRTITDVAASSDSGNESKVSDATLPTTGYVDKEIEALDDHFLIKDDPDNNQSVAGPVTFEQDVTVQGDHTVKGDTDVQGITVHGQASMEGGVTFGEFQDVAGNVQGAKVDDKGVGTFAGLKSKYFEIYELIYNQQTAEEGVKMFTDRGVIEEVKDITYYGNDRQGTYSDTDEYFKADALIKLRKERDGQLITFKKWDVIHGMVNSIGDRGEYAIGGEAWFRVVSVNQDAFEMEVEIYADRETPADKNIVPTSSMVIARWGHKDGSTDDGLRRQTSFYLSCEDGNITQLIYVTKPIIGLNNYGSVLGVLPPALYEYVQNAYAYVNPEQPYLYARGIAVQDLMLLDYLGQPIKQARYRGVWNEDTAKSDDEPYVITESTYDTVTHNGSIWQLNVSHTTEPPSDDSGEWTKIVSKGEDSTATMYDLKPSANIIYYRTADKTLSINTLDVKVGQTTSHGYSVIEEQYVLEELGLKVSYAIDGVVPRHDINISPVAAFLLEDGTAVIATEDGYGLSLEGEDIDVESIKDNITLYLTDTTTGEDMTSYIIPVVKDGEEGKEGKRGRMLYPAGDYDEKATYKIENNAAPFVRYQKDENSKPTFYVLECEDEDGVVGIDPADDYANNGGHWAPFEYMKYLFAEFLMAQWAQFGSDKGAVFYDRFLFSQYGFDKNGNFVHYSDYKGDKGNKGNMFNEEGTLSGDFTPSLAVDLYSGSIKANKLAETFAEYQYSYLPVGENRSDTLYANEIDFNQTYNVKYSPHYGDVCLLTMPLSENLDTNPPFKAQADTAIDGLKSIVINRANMSWERRYRATIHDEGGASGFTDFDDIVDASKGSLLLCATPKLFHPYTWYVNGGVIYNDELTSPTGDIAVGYFVVDGLVSNFLLLEQGMRAILRSCRDTDGKLYWYVENGSDFVSMPYTVYVKMPKVYDVASASLVDVPSNISMWSNVGYETSGYGAIQRRCFVSKSLYEIYEKLENNTLNIDIEMTDGDEFYAMDSVENWSWEKCVYEIRINSNHTDD